MFGRSLALSLAALLAAAGLGWAGPNDTLRLDGKGGATTLKLGFKGEADTLLVRGGHPGGYHVGYRAGGHPGGYRTVYHAGYRYGGYRAAYHYGYRYGGYRYFYPRYYRSYYAGYYWPWWWGFSLGYDTWPAYYYNPASAVYYYTPSYTYYYPPRVSLSLVPSTTILSTPSRVLEGPSRIEVAPPPSAVPPADGTYQYDGGPQNPVPMPSPVQPAPTAVPQGTLPLDGRAVSLPAASGKYVYLAYGEKPQQPVDLKPQIFRVVKLDDGR